MTNTTEHQAVFASDLLNNKVKSNSINEDQKLQIVREYKLLSAGKMDEQYFNLITSGRTKVWNEADWTSYWNKKR